jgi:2-polyprenyl-3-methyl-5-hydroxy-6-metoxy-1,4-benzoquinol methylase
MIFHKEILPSEFLQGWFSNDYLSSFPKEKFIFEEYYKAYIITFSSHTQNSYNHNLSPAISIVKNHSPKSLRLLEVGCGCGTESLFFSLLGCDVVAVELMEKYLNVAQTRKKIVEENISKSLKLNFHHSSIMDFDDSEKFDLIWMEQAFHHLEPRKLIVKKISSLLKPGGYLVISEANAYNPIIQISLMRERFRTHNNPFKTVIRQRDKDGMLYLWGHERILIPIKLTSLFAKEGIVKREIDYFKILPNKAIIKAKITKENYRAFPDNNFTQWLDKFLHNMPLFFKRFISASYNYVGIKLSN